ncbi:Uncharacterised protein [Starkeya nomas]|uniref:DUF2155 domain-containing protein n=2 Tax=Xanthobacteraceae TaxID=335928 RepID=A0A5S9NHC4_9HYPH|nr:DUF2155 domain-containing protein [Ancylobacter moscoviensis]CAA0089110.1 Uncharacterised protein [Starkeya nomas]
MFAGPLRSALLTAVALLALAGPLAAQQGWQGGVDSQPLAPPADVPSGAVDNPDSPPPGGPGVPSIMEDPDADAPRAPAPTQPEVPGQATVGPSGDIEVVQPPDQKIENKTAVFSGLDKITGRIISFDVAINETVQFGALRITPRACYTRPQTEQQNTTGFVEVQEITLEGKMQPLFGGWMFASSPGLHGVEHPIYDVWLTDCKQSAPVIASPGGQQ